MHDTNKARHKHHAAAQPRHPSKLKINAGGRLKNATWGTVSTGLTGVGPSDAFLLVAPDACCRALRGVCLGVPVMDVSQLADPSRMLARDDARTDVERLGLFGTVRRRGVSEMSIKNPETGGGRGGEGGGDAGPDAIALERLGSLFS